MARWWGAVPIVVVSWLACGDDAPSSRLGASGPGGSGGNHGGGSDGGCIICQGGMAGISPTGGNGPLPCDDPSECPGMDTDCSTRSCDGGFCGLDYAASGTPCDDGGGSVCNASGQCIVCNAPVTAPGGGGCPAACTSCNGTTCVIDCSSGCAGQRRTCPPDYDCHIDCGPGGCQNATLGCEPTYACSVTCSGAASCQGAAITCSSGICDVACSGDATACQGASVSCGSEACSVTCNGSAAPAQSCIGSCDCTTC